MQTEIINDNKKEEMINGSLDIFKYDDPGAYLRDAYRKQKIMAPGISHRYISSKLGVKSSAVFSQILTGRIKPARDKVNILAEIFDLNDNEKEYLYLLFQTRKIPGLSIGIILKDYLPIKQKLQL